ncbi:hypothetical protein HZ326_4886 [Fusarium oxysporum f. sp. albedinis]|nr:hypothetical protein HZ326_4886 [Fusarium oxysporum f. sp. albedinis]
MDLLSEPEDTGFTASSRTERCTISYSSFKEADSSGTPDNPTQDTAYTFLQHAATTIVEDAIVGCVSVVPCTIRPCLGTPDPFNVKLL